MPAVGNHDKIQYIDDPEYLSKGGVLVSFVDDDKIHIGWAFIHPIKEDREFDREFAKKIAFERAVKLSERSTPIEKKIPRRYVTDLVHFVWRCRRYYKDKKLPAWTTFIPKEPEREIVPEESA